MTRSPARYSRAGLVGIAVCMLTWPAAAHDSAPAPPTAVSTAVVRQIGLSNKDCDPGKAAFSDDGKFLALNVDCGETRAGRRVWIVDLAANTVTPATPPLGGSDPNSEYIIEDGTNVLWSGGTVYVDTSMETHGARRGDPTYWDERFFSAKPGQAPQTLRHLPPAIAARLEHPLGHFPIEDTFAEAGNDFVVDGTFRIGKHLVWISNDQNDNVILRTRVGKGPVRELSRGHWELATLLLDPHLLIYPSRNGIIVYDLDAGQPTRITVTHADARPVAWLATSRKLAYTSTRGCDGKQQPGERSLCIINLP